MKLVSHAMLIIILLLTTLALGQQKVRRHIPAARAQQAPETVVRESPAVAPLIRVSPDSLRFDLARFGWSSQTLTVFNDGDQPLTLSVSDVQTSAAPAVGPSAGGGVFHPQMITRLRKKLRAALADFPLPTLPAPQMPSTPTSPLAVIDPAGDVTLPGIDIIRLDASEDLFSYILSIEFSAVPDTGALALISLDLDQNFATGNFPAPFGFAPGFFDLGAEYEVLFDIGNLVGDSLGIPPSAIAIAAGDTSFTPAGLAFLGFNGNQVTASFIKGLNPQLVDDDMNYSAVCATLSQAALPDLAPDYGHGLRGTESGLSWLAQADSSGGSQTPLQLTVAPGTSYDIDVRLVAPMPGGSYGAALNMPNNSSNAPALVVPVALNVNGLARPIIQVAPAQIADTLAENQSPVVYDLLVSNAGDGDLFFLASDSIGANENWLSLPMIPLNRIAGGESVSLPITVDPAGLTANRHYDGLVTFTSNDSTMLRLDIPLDIFILGPGGIDDRERLPRRTVLYENYPDPFNPQTTIRFDLPRGEAVTLSIYNLLGEQVRSLVDGPLAAGSYDVRWDGRDDAGRRVASGSYIYRLQTADGVFSKPMTLIR